MVKKFFEKPEDGNFELKSSLRWDYKECRVNKELEFVIAKTLAAFMNTLGGILLIGVSDSNEILGLQKDYATLGKEKRNRDGFELRLNQVIQQYIGITYSEFIKVSFLEAEGKEICKLKVLKSPKPIYITKDGKSLFVIRAGNQTQVLDVKEAVEYISGHWNRIQNTQKISNSEAKKVHSERLKKELELWVGNLKRIKIHCHHSQLKGMKPTNSIALLEHLKTGYQEKWNSWKALDVLFSDLKQKYRDFFYKINQEMNIIPQTSNSYLTNRSSILVCIQLLNKLPVGEKRKLKFEVKKERKQYHLSEIGIAGELDIMLSDNLQDIEKGKEIINKVVNDEGNRIKAIEIDKLRDIINDKLELFKSYLHKLILIVEHGGLLKGTCEFCPN